MNGARIGRRGKLQGGRQGSAGQAAACPSDPFGTGLMIAGGYANGHPLAGGGSVDGNRRAASPAVAAPRRATRAGPGRAASPLAANPSASRAAIARLHPPSRARKRPLAGGGGAAAGAPGAGRRAGGARRPASRRVRAAAVAAPRRPVAAATRPKGRARKGAAVRLARARGRAATSRVRRVVPRREAMIGSARRQRARVAPGRAGWRPGSSGALSPGRRLLGVVPPSWRSGCWRGLPADSSRLIVSP